MMMNQRRSFLSLSFFFVIDTGPKTKDTARMENMPGFLHGNEFFLLFYFLS